MSQLAHILLTLGGLLLIGLVTDLLGRRTFLPRVTLLLILGFLIGPSALDLLPDPSEEWFTLFATMALVMVGFLLGEKLALTSLREHGRKVLWMSIGVVVATAAVVFLGLWLIGVPTDIALLLAGIATATAPAATIDVVHEARADGPFTRTLLGIVAVDDAWGLIVFSVTLGVAQMLNGHGGMLDALGWGLQEFGGALLVGAALGVPMAYLTGRIQPGEPSMVEGLGAVFLCGGIAIWLNVSYLLAAMVMGAIVANLARHHARPFHAIEGIEWPFMILFFILAGASLRIDSLHDLGVVGLAYVLLRVAGRIAGSWLGGVACEAESQYRRWMGLALMPQAGVAIGMALVASHRFPDLSSVLLPVVIGATVVFEISGPILTRRALVQMKEAHRAHSMN